MKIHKFKRSIFYSIFFVVILRLLFLFIPIYSSRANLVVPKVFRLYEIDQGIFEIDLGAHTGNKKCLNIKLNYDSIIELIKSNKLPTNKDFINDLEKAISN